jgi:hypothetical protein
MNALITPLLFSRFDTTAPAGLVPASSALALFRFANFAIIYFKKSGSALPVKLAISLKGSSTPLVSFTVLNV